MQLNFTFFLQIFNFIITYWFLNRFMFKPVLAHILMQKKSEDKINLELKQKQEFIYNLEKQKQEELFDFQEEAGEKYKIDQPEIVDIPAEIECVLDKQEAEYITKIAADILVKRVPHVD